MSAYDNLQAMPRPMPRATVKKIVQEQQVGCTYPMLLYLQLPASVWHLSSEGCILDLEGCKPRVETKPPGPRRQAYGRDKRFQTQEALALPTSCSAHNCYSYCYMDTAHTWTQHMHGYSTLLHMHGHSTLLLCRRCTVFIGHVKTQPTNQPTPIPTLFVPRPMPRPTFLLSLLLPLPLCCSDPPPPRCLSS